MREKDSHGGRGSRLAHFACALVLAAPCLAGAQQPAAAGSAPASQSGARDMPRPDELEPGVNTTPPASASASPATKGPDVVAAPPAASAAAPAAAPGSAATAGSGAAKTSGARQKETAAKAAARKGPDRLELDATDITGNRELPKVLYIVPWKRSDLGDVVGKPVNSLLDEVLQPLDRDVFRRENRYYDSLQGAGGDAKPGTAQGSPNKP